VRFAERTRGRDRVESSTRRAVKTIEQLNAGLDRKLTPISAPAGFVKATLMSEWAAGCKRPVV